MMQQTIVTTETEITPGQVSFLMLNAAIGLKSGWEDVEYFHKVCSRELASDLTYCLLADHDD